MINNYQRLLNLNYKNYLALIIVIILTIILTVYISTKSLYEKIDLMAVSDGNNLVLAVPVEYSDILLKKAILNIDNQNCNYEIQLVSELLYDEVRQINYQNFVIATNKKYPLNAIVKVTFYYQKEKIIRKVINFIKEWGSLKKLNNYELKNIKGGGATFWMVLGGIGLLILGIFDGYRNPLKCNNG